MKRIPYWLILTISVVIISLFAIVLFFFLEQYVLSPVDKSKQGENTTPLWLNNLINKDIKNNTDSEVMVCKYNNETVYYYQPGCCDQFSILYSQEGEVLCAPGGGFDGKGDGKCPDFDMQTCSPYWENEILNDTENNVVENEIINEENTKSIKGYIKSINNTSITIDEIVMLSEDDAANACIDEGNCDSDCLLSNSCLDNNYYISDTSKTATQYDLDANCIYTLIDYSLESIQNREVSYDEFFAQYTSAIQNDQNPLYELVLTNGMVTSINEVYIP